MMRTSAYYWLLWFAVPIVMAFVMTNKRTTTSRVVFRAGARTHKQDMDAILIDMGLTQVRNNSSSNQKQKKKKRQKQGKQQQLDVSLEIQLEYARNGHACFRSLLDPSMLQELRMDLMEHATLQNLGAWQQKVEVAFNSPKLASSCSTIEQCQEKLQEAFGQYNDEHESLPFLQHFNTWKHVPLVETLVRSNTTLAQAASVLMDVPRVRLYQDSLFWKRHGDGCTPWHVDGRMMPFDTSHSITFWIPLQPIPKDGTALRFVPKSHSDFSLAFWNDFEDGTEYTRLEERYRDHGIVHYMPVSLGDATVHSGWTLHCTNDNHHDAGTDRLALAVTYVDANAEVREDAKLPPATTQQGGCGDNEDYWSYKDWVSDVPARKPFEHPLVPIVWPPQHDSNV